MTLATQARAALAAIIAAHPDCTVALINSNPDAPGSATGFVGSRRGAGELMESGNMGQPAQSVWCNADDIGTVLLGWGLTVDGVRVNVLQPPQLDPAGALLRIDYTVNAES